MRHVGTKILETPRIILRPFAPADAEAMFRNWASDPEVTKFLSWPTHASVEVSQAVLESWVVRYEKENTYIWAIVLKDAGEPIGCISASYVRDDIKTAHIGYCIGRPWWNLGITSEALSAVIAFFFDQVGVNRIEARHDPHNPNSGKVMTKCGMIYEGTKRQADFTNQGVGDCMEYALLAEDYHAARTKDAPMGGC